MEDIEYREKAFDSEGSGRELTAHLLFPQLLFCDERESGSFLLLDSSLFSLSPFHVCGIFASKCVIV